MVHVPSRITVDAGLIPFRTLDLLGQSVSDLPGTDWIRLDVTSGDGPETRYVYPARGQAGGSVIEIRVVARVYQDKIWAVGVHCAPYLLRLSGGGDARWLVAVPRPDGVPVDTVNWIATGPDGPYDLGVAA